mmetsp:Transcript_20490/g.31584  ORF Transcript_20490/g.31584 Transcript_20490/m.31584 type:complete len:220 (+) Transcript_20490:36-695(+)
MKPFKFIVTMVATLKFTQSFVITSSSSSHLQRLSMHMTTPSKYYAQEENPLHLDRRVFIARATEAIGWATIPIVAMPSPALASDDVAALLSQVKEARAQLDSIPELIKAEKWDSVRAILITPPLSDCWAKNAKPTLQRYAEAVGDAGGDELAVLEGREDAFTHLRYLDMAVYNNVFNPITTEGRSGATKELVRSYDEDPKMELKASIAALDQMINAASE